MESEMRREQEMKQLTKPVLESECNFRMPYSIVPWLVIAENEWPQSSKEKSLELQGRKIKYPYFFSQKEQL